MDFSFLVERVQGVLIVDTTNEISEAIRDLGIPVKEGSIILICLVIASGICTRHPVAAQVAYLATATLAGFLIIEHESHFPDSLSFASTVAYLMFSITVLMVLKWLPATIQEMALVGRARFVFAYAAGARAAGALSHSYWTGVLSLCLCVILFVQKRTWFPRGGSSMPLFLRAAFPVLRQTIITLTVQIFVTRDLTAGSVQDVVYCLNLMAVLAFLAAVIHEVNWRSYAVWRVADHIIQDLADVPGNSLFSLSLATVSLYMLGAVTNMQDP